MTKKIQAVLFDCDGVLIDTEAVANQCFKEILEQYGVLMSLEEVTLSFKGLATVKCIEWVKDKKGMTLPESFLSDYRTEVRKRIREEAPLVPGILKVITHLEENQIPFAVASSTSEKTLHMNLKAKGLYPHFEERIFSCSQIDKYKPLPDVYLWAAQKIQIPIQHCLIIEDSKPGIQAAIASGAHVIQYNAEGHDFGFEVQEITDMTDVIKYL